MTRKTDIIGLPFVSASQGSTAFWTVDASGDWQQDNSTGRDYADACIDYMRVNDNPAVLGSVVTAMVAGGVCGGIEIGFMSRIAAAAIRAS